MYVNYINHVCVKLGVLEMMLKRWKRTISLVRSQQARSCNNCIYHGQEFTTSHKGHIQLLAQRFHIKSLI